MKQFRHLEASFKSANHYRTYLDDSQCGWHLDRLGGKIVMVERMVDLGAEFANINDYYTPLFAEYARKFEDFAEGNSSLLIHSLHSQEQCLTID